MTQPHTPTLSLPDNGLIQNGPFRGLAIRPGALPERMLVYGTAGAFIGTVATDDAEAFVEGCSDVFQPMDGWPARYSLQLIRLLGLPLPGATQEPADRDTTH